MNLSDKLESLDCRRDDKARRVLNTAPDTVANITAETLEKGVTLEALEALNVPVYRYGTQVTIHGKLPDFNPDARPGGYKAIFRNGNGSIGVRYGAIDAEKKKLIARAARVSVSGWGTAQNSTGFEISRSFRVKDEAEREQVKQAALACLRSVPASRFFGSAFAGCLPYGMGYYVGVSVGAIAQTDLWPFIGELLGVTPESLAELEAEQARKDAERRAQWDAEREASRLQREEKRKVLLATLPAPLTVEPKTPGQSFRILDSFTNELLTVVLSGTGKRVFYTITHRNGEKNILAKRKILGTGWPKALKEGRLFPA